MFAIAQLNFTKQSCQTAIFQDPLITYRAWKIVDLIPQGSSSAGQLQTWYFTLLSWIFPCHFSLNNIIWSCCSFLLLWTSKQTNKQSYKYLFHKLSLQSQPLQVVYKPQLMKFQLRCQNHNNEKWKLHIKRGKVEL